MTRRANVDLFARRPAKRARAEGDSIVVYRSGETLDGGAEQAEGERRARRAAEAALAAMRVAARRVQDLSGLVYELDAQLPGKDAERSEQVHAPTSPRRPSCARRRSATPRRWSPPATRSRRSGVS